MNKGKIRVLIKEPGKEPTIEEIDDTLKTFQKIVGGHIELIEMPGTDDIDIYANDEAMLNHEPGNIWIAGTGDCVKGTCYMVGYDSDTGDNISLTDDQIKICRRYIKTFELPKEADLYRDYFQLVPKMYKKSEKYLNKSISEMWYGKQNVN